MNISRGKSSARPTPYLSEQHRDDRDPKKMQKTPRNCSQREAGCLSSSTSTRQRPRNPVLQRQRPQRRNVRSFSATKRTMIPHYNTEETTRHFRAGLSAPDSPPRSNRRTISVSIGCSEQSNLRRRLTCFNHFAHPSSGGVCPASDLEREKWSADFLQDPTTTPTTHLMLNSFSATSRDDPRGSWENTAAFFAIWNFAEEVRGTASN